MDHVPVTADDHGLVELLRHGDEHAYSELVQRYHPSLIRLARRYVGDQANAEDVAQETWLAMLEGLDRFSERSSLRTWLFHIVVNCARTSRRRTSRSIPFSAMAAHSSSPDDAESSFSTFPFDPSDTTRSGPEEHIGLMETAQRLRNAVGQLPPRQRTILMLRDVEGRSTSEICSLLGVTPVNERVLLHRARARLRRELVPWLRQV